MTLLRLQETVSNAPPEAAAPTTLRLRPPHLARQPAGRDSEVPAEGALVARLRHGDDATNLSAWMHRIVVSCALARRRISGRPPGEGVNVSALEASCVAEDTSRAGSIAPGTAQREVQVRLHQAVGRLPDIPRAAARLHDVHGLSLAETSRLLGRPPAAVHARIQLGRSALRAILSSRDEDPHSSSESARVPRGLAATTARTREATRPKEHVRATPRQAPSALQESAHTPHVVRGATGGGVPPHLDLLP